MDDNLKTFKEYIRYSDDTFLVDMLIETVGKMHDDMTYSYKVNILKKELLNRLN